MTHETHMRRGHPITFGLLIFFGIIELSIAAWLTSQFNKFNNEQFVGERDRVRYTLFASIWTVVFSALFLILFAHSPNGSMLTSVLAHLVYLTLTWIIWTAAAAAITDVLGGGLDCSLGIYTYCHQLDALEAFAWVEWILVTFAIIVVIICAIVSARRGNGVRGHLV
ncbi:MARVEL domain-containing protein [Mycena venus]|uniref:MARVEL domain-containing protein n=1 Tax=Mycena venus TaxID=2733690 RepID=A0A8H6XVI8_9AGAR|nr:MARVEL domain-containing protein [Mycena venus]